MKVLSILGQKGGNGKTTAALGLAVAASMAGQEVAVIDLDPQTTAANWSDRRGRDRPAVVSCQVSRLPQVLDAAAKGGADLAIVDTPGKSTDALIAAARAADFALSQYSRSCTTSRPWAASRTCSHSPGTHRLPSS